MTDPERPLFVRANDNIDTSTVPPLLTQCLVAEYCGTFGLVFIGTGALVVNEMTGGDITHVGVSLSFGLTVLAMIYAFGDVSGAHINPAVTVGFWASGRFDGRRVPGYVVASVRVPLRQAVPCECYFRLLHLLVEPCRVGPVLRLLYWKLF